MAEYDEENAPEEIGHFCASCLQPVAEDALECAHCSRRFDGRGRFDAVAEPAQAVESISLLRSGAA